MTLLCVCLTNLYFKNAIHPQDAGRFPGCEWRPRRGPSAQSPKPDRWWWSPDCWGGHELSWAADHTDSEEEEEEEHGQHLHWYSYILNAVTTWLITIKCVMKCLTGQLRRSPMLAFRSSSPNMPGVAFSLVSNIFTAWLLRRRTRRNSFHSSSLWLIIHTKRCI